MLYRRLLIALLILSTASPALAKSRPVHKLKSKGAASLWCKPPCNFLICPCITKPQKRFKQIVR